MSVQLAKLSSVKHHFLRQFYLKGTSGKMSEGWGSDDYNTFLKATRFNNMVKMLGEFPVYKFKSQTIPKIDLETTLRLMEVLNSHMEKKIDAKNVELVFKAVDNSSLYTIYNVDSLEHMKLLFSGFNTDKDVEEVKQLKAERKERRENRRLVRLTKKRTKLLNQVQDRKDKLFKIKEDLCKKRFISLDFEAFERCHQKITEIGISVMDGNECYHRHLIIEENIKLRNGKFVPDNKFNFSFGESEIVTLNEALLTVSGELAISDYLVGSGLGNEIKWLEHNRVLSNGVKTADTAKLAGAFFKTAQRVGLEKILRHFNIDYRFLHNAANDSAYTMEALNRMVMAI
jgi:hypothetical protein